MEYKNIIFEKKENINAAIIRINRLKSKNAINLELLIEINNAMDKLDNTQCNIIIVEGMDGVFCSGLDFRGIMEESTVDTGDKLAKSFAQLLKRFTLAPQVIISKVNGEVIGGGVGIVAASDFVVATNHSKFCLSEALWGLLPAIITPYLIRRIGFHNAYKMSISALSYSAQEAYQINLVDKLGNDTEKSIDSLCKRIKLMNPSTIQKLKQFYTNMWIIKKETEDESISTIIKVMQDKEIRKNIENFVKYQRFPWSNR